MKLSTLLLSSAALVVAGSAYAADLPAKKGAPAAKPATGCPAFGAGFFQIPGGDTCIQFSGRVTYDASYSGQSDKNDAARYGQAGGFRFQADVRNNTEIGAIRSFIRQEVSGGKKAYIQFSGVTAGLKDSLADIAGTSPVQFGAGWSQPDTGIYYTFAAGSTSFSVGLENAANKNSGGGISDRPDAIIKVSSAFGPANVKIAAISHEAVGLTSGAQQGYAFLGHIDVKASDNVTIIAFGGTSSAAGSYTGSNASTYDTDTTASYALKGSSLGGEVDLSFGKAALIVAARQNVHEGNGSKVTDKSYTVATKYSLAKGLDFYPEVLWGDTTNAAGEKSNTSGAYLRIERDF